MAFPNKSGIYVIVNVTNGHRYIGQASCLRRRLNNHRSCLRRGIHDNAHLQRAWNKYGEHAFDFKVERLCPVEALDDIETMLLNAEPRPEYNIARDGSVSGRGLKRSADARRKMSLAKKTKPMSAATRAARAAQAMPVERIDPSTGLVVEYRTIKSAARDGFTHPSIKAAISQSRPYKGFYWIRSAS